MKRYVWAVILTMGGLAVGAGSALAQDDIAAGGVRLAAPDTTESDLARVAEYEANRERTISELLRQWAPAKGASQLGVALRTADDGKLLEVARAGSFKEVERILLGDIIPNTLGATDQDYVFTPVTPCRIFDTRNIGGGTPILAGGNQEFYVYGPAGDIGPQGGEPAGCPQPAGKGEPRAVHLNLTVVPIGVQGNARIYPSNEATPNASVINFKLGTNTANALTVKTFVSIGPREVEVFVSADAHVLADVMGYYYDAVTPGFMASTSAAQAVPDGVETTILFNVENHDIGGVYNPATGIFTVPVTGRYNVSCHFVYQMPAGTIRYNIYLKRNAGDLAVTFGNNLANNDFAPRMLSGTWQLTAGDTVRCNAFLQTPGAGGSVVVSGPTNFFSAAHVP